MSKNIQIVGSLVPQADWNEKDKNSLAYVKNKPFEMVDEKREVYPWTEGTVRFESDYYCYETNKSVSFSKLFDGVPLGTRAQISYKTPIIADNDEIILGDIETYEAELKYCELNYGEGIFKIYYYGNIHKPLYLFNNAPNTGEPYCIYSTTLNGETTTEGLFNQTDPFPQPGVDGDPDTTYPFAFTASVDIYELPSNIQTQPDWNTTDVNSAAYIRNKPDVNGLTSELYNTIQTVVEEMDTKKADQTWVEEQLGSVGWDTLANKPFEMIDRIEEVYPMAEYQATFDIDSGLTSEEVNLPKLFDGRTVGDKAILNFIYPNWDTNGEVTFREEVSHTAELRYWEGYWINDNEYYKIYYYGNLAALNMWTPHFPNNGEDLLVFKIEITDISTGETQIAYGIDVHGGGPFMQEFNGKKFPFKFSAKNIIYELPSNIQSQADWEEKDKNSSSYLLNKPFYDVPDVVSTNPDKKSFEIELLLDYENKYAVSASMTEEMTEVLFGLGENASVNIVMIGDNGSDSYPLISVNETPKFKVENGKTYGYYGNWDFPDTDNLGSNFLIKTDGETIIVKYSRGDYKESNSISYAEKLVTTITTAPTTYTTKKLPDRFQTQTDFLEEDENSAAYLKNREVIHKAFNEINEEINDLKNRPSVSDWNTLLNKPFYEEIGEVEEILPELTIEINKNAEDKYTTTYELPNLFQNRNVGDEITLSLKTVDKDNLEDINDFGTFKTELKSYENANGETVYYYGNPLFMYNGEDIIVDTKEKFLITTTDKVNATIIISLDPHKDIETFDYFSIPYCEETCIRNGLIGLEIDKEYIIDYVVDGVVVVNKTVTATNGKDLIGFEVPMIQISDDDINMADGAIYDSNTDKSIQIDAHMVQIAAQYTNPDTSETVPITEIRIRGIETVNETEWYSEIINVTLSSTYQSHNINKLDGKFQVQPDWAEEDKRSGSFIKNKPFFEDETKSIPVEIFPLTDMIINLDVDSDMPEGVYPSDTDTSIFFENVKVGEKIPLSVHIPIGVDDVTGETNYKVDDYEVELKEVSMEGMKYKYYGNIYMLSDGYLGYFDTGESFCLCIGAMPTGGKMFLSGIKLEPNEDGTYPEIEKFQLSASTTKPFIQKIPDKFQTQPDWNETDKESAAYVRNKPFEYYGLETSWLLPETTLTVEGENGYFDLYDLFEQNYSWATSIKDGDDIIISLQGKEYKSQVKSFEMEGSEFIYIGNLYYMFIDSDYTPEEISAMYNITIEDTGEPFLVAYLPEYGESMGYVYVEPTADDPVDDYYEINITFGIGYSKHNVKKLDDIFQTQTDWDVFDKESAAYVKNKPFGILTKNQGTIYDVTDKEFNVKIDDNRSYPIYGDKFDVDIVADGKYLVTFDGVEYEFIASRYEEEYVYIGNPNYMDHYYEEYYGPSPSDAPFAIFTYAEPDYDYDENGNWVQVGYYEKYSAISVWISENYGGTPTEFQIHSVKIEALSVPYKKKVPNEYLPKIKAATDSQNSIEIKTNSDGDYTIGKKFASDSDISNVISDTPLQKITFDSGTLIDYPKSGESIKMIPMSNEYKTDNFNALHYPVYISYSYKPFRSEYKSSGRTDEQFLTCLSEYGYYYIIPRIPAIYEVLTNGQVRCAVKIGNKYQDIWKNYFDAHLNDDNAESDELILTRSNRGSDDLIISNTRTGKSMHIDVDNYYEDSDTRIDGFAPHGYITEYEVEVFKNYGSEITVHKLPYALPNFAGDYCDADVLFSRVQDGKTQIYAFGESLQPEMIELDGEVETFTVFYSSNTKIRYVRDGVEYFYQYNYSNTPTITQSILPRTDISTFVPDTSSGVSYIENVNMPTALNQYIANMDRPQGNVIVDNSSTHNTYTRYLYHPLVRGQVPNVTEADDQNYYFYERDKDGNMVVVLKISNLTNEIVNDLTNPRSMITVNNEIYLLSNNGFSIYKLVITSQADGVSQFEYQMIYKLSNDRYLYESDSVTNLLTGLDSIITFNNSKPLTLLSGVNSGSSYDSSQYIYGFRYIPLRKTMLEYIDDKLGSGGGISDESIQIASDLIGL